MEYTERDLGGQELNQRKIHGSGREGKIPVGLGQLGKLELERRPHVLSIRGDRGNYPCLLVEPKTFPVNVLKIPHLRNPNQGWMITSLREYTFLKTSC